MVFSLKLAADLNILTPAHILLVQHNWIYLTTFDMMSRFFHNEPQQTLTDTLRVDKIKSYTLFRKTTLKGGIQHLP